ncbi:unnamed protein product [Gongylonema pulchrum]|uniref:Jupiter microtubule associated homolog 1 n=1 Tax=Gongylonema pulchrum TaxID=637853 RepID=A0A183DAW4_9BILA|nr:unnamed protein product [Gongylonema pulchrum]
MATTGGDEEQQRSPLASHLIRRGNGNNGRRRGKQQPATTGGGEDNEAQDVDYSFGHNSKKVMVSWLNNPTSSRTDESFPFQEPGESVKWGSSSSANNSTHGQRPGARIPFQGVQEK